LRSFQALALKSGTRPPEKKRVTPSIESLSDKLLNCVQETPSIQNNFLQKFHLQIFDANLNLLPETLRTYEKLNVAYAPLKLIPPIFETPMLGLTPSVFPTVLVEQEPPKLELFDLDDEFANQEWVY
jgi:intraflagellar transport protein 52